jgi:hypothetical protein
MVMIRDDDENLAFLLIEQHGSRAAFVALERLNQSIDRRDVNERDRWARVVHAIHRHYAGQGRGGRGH